jgi:hypothetical protein
VTKEPLLAEFLFKMGLVHEIPIGVRNFRVKGRTYYEAVIIDRKDKFQRKRLGKIFSIEEVRRPDPRTVLYDIQVDGDATFVGQGITFHNCQFHKVKKKVLIRSEDGADLTHRFPTLVSELRSQKDDFVIDAEVTGWTSKEYRKGKHIGRSDVSGYAHKKTKPDDSFFFPNVFDCLWLNGEDLHKKPLSERRKALEKIGSFGHFHVIEMRVAKNEAELRKAVKYFSGFPGSEGAMIKSLKSEYPLRGMTRFWIKFKKEVDLDAKVVAVHKVKGTAAYNYLCAIRDGKGNLIPVGRTYNTKIKVPVGGIIRVAFVNLNKYTDPKTGQEWFNWWAPRPIEYREDKSEPDDVSTANRIVFDTKGEVGEKRFPSRYKGLLEVAGELEQNGQLFERLDVKMLGKAVLLECGGEKLLLDIPLNFASIEPDWVFVTNPEGERVKEALQHGFRFFMNEERENVTRVFPGQPVKTGRFEVTPFRVSERYDDRRVGYRVTAGGKSLIFCPELAAEPEAEILRGAGIFIGSPKEVMECSGKG